MKPLPVFVKCKKQNTSIVFLKMVHDTANLVNPVAQRCGMHKRHSKKRVLYIFFSVSFVMFVFAITGNKDSDSTQNPTFPCGKCSFPVTDDHQGCNAILVIYGSMHHARVLGICYMITYQTQIALNVIP